MYDTYRFLHAFAYPIQQSTPHLYISALVWIPKESIIGRQATTKKYLMTSFVHSSMYRTHGTFVGCHALFDGVFSSKTPTPQPSSADQRPTSTHTLFARGNNVLYISIKEVLQHSTPPWVLTVCVASRRIPWV